MSADETASGLYKHDGNEEAERRNYTQLTDIHVDYRRYIDWQAIPIGERWMADYWCMDKRKYFKYLDDTSKGILNGPKWSNTPLHTHLANRDLIWIIADKLGLTTRQKPLVETFFTSLNLGKWGVRKEIVAVAVCLYFVHSDENDMRECHPFTKEENAKLYYEAIEKFDLPPRMLKKEYFKVQTYYLTGRGGRVYKPLSLPSIEGDSERDVSTPDSREKGVTGFRDWHTVRDSVSGNRLVLVGDSTSGEKAV